MEEKSSREGKGRNKEREQGRQTSEVLELGRSNLCCLFFRLSSLRGFIKFPVLNNVYALDQRYSTGGTRRHPKILFFVI
jgi:hypothetical protein